MTMTSGEIAYLLFGSVCAIIGLLCAFNLDRIRKEKELKK
jgi:hypothetical protein